MATVSSGAIQRISDALLWCVARRGVELLLLLLLLRTVLIARVKLEVIASGPAAIVAKGDGRLCHD